MDINLADKISHTTQYHEAFLMYMENEYSAKHRWVPVNEHDTLLRSNHIPSITVLIFCQSTFDPDDLSSDDEEYWTPNNVAESTPGRSKRASPLSTATKLYLNSPPEALKNRGQINPNLNDDTPMQCGLAVNFGCWT